jgi:hypothetical protein
VSQAWWAGFAKACQDSGIVAYKTARNTTMNLWATEAFAKRASRESDLKVQEIYSDLLNRDAKSPGFSDVQSAMYPLRNNPTGEPDPAHLEALHAKVRAMAPGAPHDLSTNGARAKMLHEAPVDETPVGHLRQRLALADPAAPGHAELHQAIEQFATNPGDAAEWSRLHAAATALPPKAKAPGPTPMLAQQAAAEGGGRPTIVQRGLARFGRPAAMVAGGLGALGLGALAYRAMKDREAPDARQ